MNGKRSLLQKHLLMLALLGLLCLWGCPFRRLLGLSCPGCGMTRAWLCALRGQWQSALAYHRLFWAGPPLILLFAHRNAVPAVIRPLWNGGMWMLAALLLAEQLRRCLPI